MTLRRLWLVFILILAASVVAELFIAPQPHFAVERLFAFNAVYGYLACAFLVLLAKALGLLLKRRDTYYDD